MKKKKLIFKIKDKSNLFDSLQTSKKYASFYPKLCVIQDPIRIISCGLEYAAFVTSDHFVKTKTKNFI